LPAVLAGAMDLATVDRLLTTTRTVRRRLDVARPVEREVLERCIEIALQAPTGSNAQGWHFVIVTDPEKRRRLATSIAAVTPSSRGCTRRDRPIRRMTSARVSSPGCTPPRCI